MNGGQGLNSYANNSTYQRGGFEAVKPIMEEEIATKLDLKNRSSKTPFRIADFGCSTGLNSFPAMQTIIQAIEKKIDTQKGLLSGPPDFQVFFVDQLVNDFASLFRLLPPERNYYSAAVPGSFQDRLLPNASIDFAYSSCALNWFSKIPAAVEDRSSPAWNGGRVHYTGARREVFEAYAKHFANDIRLFLEARAREVVAGGLMALLVPAVPTFEIPDNSFATPTELDLVGSCLVDMAKKGKIKKEKIDSFNFPMYLTIPQEFQTILERNPKFSIERFEIIDSPGKSTLAGANARAGFMRAILEVLLINHFGGEIIDELFDRYTKKLASSPVFIDPNNDKSILILVILKRKPE
ncbi:loganic acid O-methyltransferase-like [Andrographis paniculata]|uniref:loganic acid O-methyltransferase-like n=1 Tax=Andrographis paniculata TaxID=175694 RepID=UPI0021E77C61|nr:loganic acid O-methyltransferase-like [Andrographis paniculata]